MSNELIDWKGGKWTNGGTNECLKTRHLTNDLKTCTTCHMPCTQERLPQTPACRLKLFPIGMLSKLAPTSCTSANGRYWCVSILVCVYLIVYTNYIYIHYIYCDMMNCIVFYHTSRYVIYTLHYDIYICVLHMICMCDICYTATWYVYIVQYIYILLCIWS